MDSSELTPGKAQKSRFFKRSKHREPQNEHVGARAEVKTFYEGPPLDDSSSDKSTRINWVEWQPPTLPEAKKVKWEGYAIQIYKIQETSRSFTNVATFKVSYISLLSPYIKHQLQDVLKYHGVTWEESITSIYWPLEPLYFAREKIAELSKIAKDEHVRAHLEQLCKTINDELGSTIDAVEDLGTDSLISHALAWTLFPKGTIVVKKDSENENINLTYRVTQSKRVSNTTAYFEIGAENVNFDGVRYRLQPTTLRIPLFQGKKPINSLPYYPLEYATSWELLKEQLCDRGKRVLDFQGIKYMRYLVLNEGDQDDSENDLTKKSARTRVIIDSFGYNITFPRFSGELLPAYQHAEGKERVPYPSPPSRNKHYPPRLQTILGPSACRPSQDLQNENRRVITAEQVYTLIMSPYLDGFSLFSKRWTTVHVDKVRPLYLTDEAYKHLVHPERNKDLVYSLVQHHKDHPNSSGDVIAGKGQGLLVLLSGPPGTGKTLMAEAIADKARLPLYYVAANEMGTPAMVNSSFDHIMTSAAEWSAIILLDEADIYLQRRSENDLTRNEIVATLLRRLEYYQGIMFLTTNLYDTIDLAVESRLHIHLRFPPLSFSSRMQIWSNFLSRLSPPLSSPPLTSPRLSPPSYSPTKHTPLAQCRITEEEIQQLALWTLNGRDIKNALKMTVSWCHQKGSKVTFLAIEDVIGATCPRARKEEMKGVDGVVESTLSHRHEIGELLDL